MRIKKYFTYRKKRFWAGLLLAQFLLFFILSKIKYAVLTFDKFFELQKQLHQKLFSSIPFSVGDLLYIILGVTLVISIFKIIKKANQTHYILRFLIGANIFYFIYQIFWGMLYFQPPLLDKLPKEEIKVEEIKRLTIKYLNLSKASRSLVQENSAGVFELQNIDEIKREILQNQANLPRFLSSKKGFQISSAKPSLFDNAMNYSGILGYYNPFTAEAQYNDNLPSTYIPFTLAHESSHQLGFAREQEANFIGYLSGKNAKNLDLKYSTEYYVLKSLLNSLVEKDESFVKKIIQQYSAGMKRDRFAEKEFQKRHEGFLDIFFGFVNDLFLKSNQQDGSITYSYFVELLVRYEGMKF